MKTIYRLLLSALMIVNMVQVAEAAGSVTYDSGKGPGAGKHIVFLAGDEEYRSEESLPQMARILAVRHGFKCTVLFSINADGIIDPNASASLSDPETLKSADAIFMMLRYRQWPDETMKLFEDAYLRGVPIIGLRTSTHAFKYPLIGATSPFAKYSADRRDWVGGFGRQVLGETWVSHLGTNHKEATRGMLEASAAGDPILRGIGTIFAHTGAYTAKPMEDSTILMRAEVLAGTTPDSPPSKGKNSPHQPIAWHRVHQNAAGKTNRVFCTTMGSSTDILDENLRRMLVNAVYWGFEMEVPEKANVELVGDFKPTDYGFNTFKQGVKPDELALPTK